MTNTQIETFDWIELDNGHAVSTLDHGWEFDAEGAMVGSLDVRCDVVDAAEWNDDGMVVCDDVEWVRCSGWDDALVRCEACDATLSVDLEMVAALHV